MKTIPKPLGGRPRDVLDAIARLENDRHVILSSRIADDLGIARQHVRTYLLNLSQRQLIDYAPSDRRITPIRLTEEGWRTTSVPRRTRSEDNGTLTFPILGEVAAGHPAYADNQVEARASRLQDVLDLHDGDFLLRVRGDSMIGIGIYPGDLVVIHPDATEPLAGEIVLIGLPGDDAATLKRWHRNNGTVTLSSENVDYAPMIYPTDEVVIQGTLVGHIGSGRARRAP